VQYGDRVTEYAYHPRNGLRSERDFRDEHDRTASVFDLLSKSFQVDQCFAATRHSPEKRRVPVIQQANRPGCLLLGIIWRRWIRTHNAIEGIAEAFTHLNANHAPIDQPFDDRWREAKLVS
jgi:hypothetical protein